MSETKLKIQSYGTQFNAPEGYLLNGKIVPSVASNNLTVALKTLAGTDATASNPIIIRIGDTVHSITSALSVTKNAGTNWFNAGGTVRAAHELDYFVYLGYNATDGVVIGFSPVYYGKEYGDFSTTTTDSDYCAISTITNAASGDDYTIIGRFSATLSAGAGYTWTVPTFDSTNLIQNPNVTFDWAKCCFKATLGGTTQTSISNLDTIEFDTATYDPTGGLGATTSYRWDIPKSGIYHFDCMLRFNGVADGTTVGVSLVGGSDEGVFEWIQSGAAANIVVHLSCDYFAMKGDGVYIQSVGSGATADGATSRTFFSGRFVAPLIE